MLRVSYCVLRETLPQDATRLTQFLTYLVLLVPLQGEELGEELYAVAIPETR